MAFRWRADDSPTLNDGLVAAIFRGIRTCITRKPDIFVIFQGGGSGPLVPSPPSGSALGFKSYNTKAEHRVDSHGLTIQVSEVVKIEVKIPKIAKDH